MSINNSQLANWYLSLAQNALAQEDYVAAKAMAETALSLDRSSKAFNIIGICLRELSDYILALAYFDEALKIQPDQPEVRLNKATTLEMLGKLLKLKPLDTESMSALGNETMGLTIFVREEGNNA
jgi:tetratricopeptide (TPR) repeat protein